MASTTMLASLWSLLSHCLVQELKLPQIYDINAYQSTGNGRSMLSNRISWFFDLKGPSITLDTACSSSMYGLHLACQSIRTGESTQALVCGTNMILNPDLMRSLTAMRFLSPDGMCHSFDHRANVSTNWASESLICGKTLEGDCVVSENKTSFVSRAFQWLAGEQ